jgi:hypothetical protein
MLGRPEIWRPIIKIAGVDSLVVPNPENSSVLFLTSQLEEVSGLSLVRPKPVEWSFLFKNSKRRTALMKHA